MLFPVFQFCACTLCPKILVTYSLCDLADTGWGTLPVLTIDGKEYGQTLAMTRYISHMTGTAARDVTEAVHLDTIADVAQEIYYQIGQSFEEEDETRKVCQ